MRPLTVLLVVIGVLFLGAAFIYATTEARALPGFFPGYDTAITRAHLKHAVAAVLLGLGCFVLAWFSTGPRSARQQH
ncbi:MAG: hypothetical protein KGN00_07700 [Chloroflexota bacterium]|nr:hypothetical protein [Chloroflexota bacterium]MDE3193554.1 hypothetical protein [Chloroflexota bacterium]